MTTDAPSRRAMASVWFFAVMISVGGMAGLLQITPDPKTEAPQRPPFGVFIGTSLVLAAVPPEDAANDIFRAAEARDLFVRMASHSLSDVETLERVRRAVNAGVKEIFVEIDPLLRTSRGKPLTVVISSGVHDFSRRLRDAAHHWLGLAIQRPSPAPDELHGIYDGQIRELDLGYPVVHAPRNPAFVAETLEMARRQGSDIVWVAMPRSQAAVAYLGPAFETAFSGQLQAFATILNTTVWRPAVFWPNEFFVDPIHMNTAGRARFMSELRRYGASIR
jgi:hypothetical protein